MRYGRDRDRGQCMNHIVKINKEWREKWKKKKSDSHFSFWENIYQKDFLFKKNWKVSVVLLSKSIIFAIGVHKHCDLWLHCMSLKRKFIFEYSLFRPFSPFAHTYWDGAQIPFSFLFLFQFFSIECDFSMMIFIFMFEYSCWFFIMSDFYFRQIYDYDHFLNFFFCFHSPSPSPFFFHFYCEGILNWHKKYFHDYVYLFRILCVWKWQMANAKCVTMFSESFQFRDLKKEKETVTKQSIKTGIGFYECC